MEGKKKSGFGGDCPLPSDTWYMMLPLLASISEYPSLFPNCILDLLRAKTVFYIYYDLTFLDFLE